MTNSAITNQIITGADLLRVSDMDASPAAALAAIAAYRREVELEVERRVASARTMGASWAVVGDALGITRQAAQQRYGRR